MSRQLVNVFLGGALGRKFGGKWQLNVASPAEAMRAIDANTRGKFRDYLFKQGRDKYYRVAVGRKNQLLEPSELTRRSGSGDIYILPTIKGSNSGGAKILIGALIIAAIIFAPEIAPGILSTTTAATATTASVTTLTVAGQIAVGVGMSLILGGISQLLAPHANTNGGELGSNYFQGTVAGAVQGGCVPVVYGRALVAPSVISIWSNNVDYNTTQNAFIGTQEAAQLNGGGTQYQAGSDSAVGGNTS